MLKAEIHYLEGHGGGFPLLEIFLVSPTWPSVERSIKMTSRASFPKDDSRLSDQEIPPPPQLA